MGLRETKKEATRRLLADTAWRLFTERGFDRVSVAEVARTAGVSEATVFNYFPTKEDLFYARMERFGTRLAEAVAARPAGQSALDAFRAFLLEATAGLADAYADPAAAERLRDVNRVIAASPALLARERQAVAANAEALARLFAEEAGAGEPDLAARAAAHALVGVHAELVAYVRRRVLAAADGPGPGPGPGDSPDGLDGLAADARAQAEAAFALLAGGLAAYAPKPAA